MNIIPRFKLSVMKAIGGIRVPTSGSSGCGPTKTTVETNKSGSSSVPVGPKSPSSSLNSAPGKASDIDLDKSAQFINHKVPVSDKDEVLAKSLIHDNLGEDSEGRAMVAISNGNSKKMVPTKPGSADYMTEEFMKHWTCYFYDEIKYHKLQIKLRQVAIKRIRKLLKKYE